ncbi:MAG: twin-arginine translocase TatA/TatE family subunit [Bacteroidales bacterium]|nr:twin-arginine translocase TatA/TatE family subunit [Bacteroidales bacterium]
MTLLMIGTTELLVVAGLALLLFGGKKLPELMKGMGQGVKNFKEGLNSPIEQPQEQQEKVSVPEEICDQSDSTIEPEQ